MHKEFIAWLEKQEYEYNFLGEDYKKEYWFIKSVHDSYYKINRYTKPITWEQILKTYYFEDDEYRIY